MKQPIHSTLKRIAAYFLIFLMLTQVYGCSFYRVKSVQDGKIATVFEMDKSEKYFVVHQKGYEVFALTDIKVDSTHITAKAGELVDSIYYSEDRSEYRYVSQEKTIIHEVHIYLFDEVAKIDMGDVQISYEDIEKIDIINADTGKIVASIILTALGIFVTVFMIVALTKSSCPYVYVHDGEDFVFAGETFGGAIMENMERDDYMPLPALQAVNGEYLLRITNELKERQYTDLAQLLVIDHAKGEKVLLDKYGSPQLITSERTPETATTFGGTDLEAVLASVDQNVFLFNEQDYSENGILLQFEKPTDATHGKLLLRAKNTLWFDFMYGKFAEKFGNRFDAWMNKRARVPTEERLDRMLTNDIPLSIYAKVKGKWQLVDYLFTVGPLAGRDFVIPIDLTDLPGENLELKIETGFMFWEIDKVTMDYSPNTEMKLNTIRPSSAMGTGGIDWLKALSQTDKHYMSQLEIGEVTQMHFKVTQPGKDQVQTAFLHTRGYYELIREFEGKPDIKQLKKFRTPGYFSQFSRSEYLKTIGTEEFTSKAYLDDF